MANVPINDGSRRTIVACIDFGTYGTSFAFAYTNDTEKRVHIETTWADQDGAYFKNLTQSLYKLSPNRQVGIGFTASARYFNFDEDLVKQHALVRRFKLGLYNNPTAEMVDPISKQTFKVVDLIGNYLASIWDLLLQKLCKAATRAVDKSQVKFVITLPAVWNERSMAIMREALVKSGIISDVNANEDDCMFVLEPEAASAFCKEKAPTLGLDPFQDGLVFMSVDAGGGTVDITIHKIEGNKLKEQTVRNGDVCGSTSIDEKFFEWLKSNFEPGCLDELFKQDPQAYHQTRVEWERIKIGSQNFDADKYINLSDSMKILVGDGKLLPASANIHRRGRIILTPATQRAMFTDALDRIGALVEEQLTNCSLTVKFIILVGGFGQCPHLFQMLTDRFVPHQVEKVVQPPGAESGAAVVSGGVLLGLDPSLIRSRRAKRTYGIEVEEIFEESRHDESRLIVRDDMFLCKGVFFPFVETGQEVDAESVIERQFDTTGGTTRISIFTSPKKKIKFVDEPMVIKLYDLSVISPASSSASTTKPFIIVKFKFGKLEFEVTATDNFGNKCETKLNFANSY